MPWAGFQLHGRATIIQYFAMESSSMADHADNPRKWKHCRVRRDDPVILFHLQTTLRRITAEKVKKMAKSIW